MERGLLSDELKKSLGVEDEALVLAQPKKKKKEQQPKQRARAKPVAASSKDSKKKKKSAAKLRGAAEEAEEQARLFQRISAVGLAPGVALQSSRSLSRRGKTAREPLSEEAVAAAAARAVEEEKEDDDEGPLVVVRKRARIVRTLPPMPPKPQPKGNAASAPQSAVTEAAKPKRAEPPRVARVIATRSAAMSEHRQSLPATTMEDEVMHAVANNDVVFICGATGSGKTTQVPQWLVEHGYRSWGMVCVTQPRRVAARMVSERVAAEMGVVWGSEVGYHVRQESKMRDFDSCNVLFATDGLLLSVLTEDVLAERYSVIVIDEAHERTLGTDVLLGMLSRIVPLRRSRYESGASEVPPLKLVIMSATLALEPLLGLFAVKPPVVSIEGRQFPVETHWMRVTPEDLESALEAAVKTVATIQQTLPRGTVLVFVPGKREISFVSQKLRELFSEEVMLLVSLHSGMDPTQQRLAFEPPPEGVRMVIVATNIAECSLTLPNVRYVVDPGYAREQVWGDDGGGGVFATRRISQASAMQRAGRAGRTVGGHVYRLYSQPLFHHHMEQHDVPQSLRLPIDSLIVTLVGMGITAPDKFPLPSPPPRSALDEAQLRLTRLGLLRCEKAPLRLTVLGAKAAELPVDPPAARMLLALGDEASPQQCRLAAAVCAVWSVGHTMWAAETEAKEKNAFVAPGPWKKALAAADILFPVCLIQMMRFGGPSAAAALRRQMGIPATAVDAFFGLATQALNRWRGKGATGGGELEPPSGSELVQLQQALLGALAHNVCRREQGYYVRLMDGATVHLHARQSSTAFREARHAWISCVELQSPNETAKRFAVYPFAINPAWLFHVAVASSEMKAAPLVDYSRIAQETARYDAAADCVMCEASPRFGPLVQALPSLVIPLRDSKEARLVFAVLLLEGAVFPALAPLAAHLHMPPRSLFGPIRLANQTDFAAALGGACRRAAVPLGQALVDAATRLYIPAVRATAAKIWSSLEK